LANIYKIDKRHKVEIDLEKLHPWAKYDLCMLLAGCAKKGIYLIVTEGIRSVDEQNILYAQGRTTKGAIITNARGSSFSSMHMWGVAFDIAINIKGHTWDVPYFKKVWKIAQDLKLPLEWGGNWKSIKDNPHFQLKEWGSTPSKLKAKYGTFENFKKTWTCTVKCSTAIRKSKLFTSKHLKDVKAGTKLNLLWKSKLGYAKVEYNEIVGFIRVRNIKK
jgi:hypothetical protein